MTDTLRNVDEAIQAHIAEKFEGSLVDSWIIVTHSQTLEGFDVSNYRIVTHDTQPLHVDAGLLDIGRRIIKDSWDAAFDEEDE